MPKAISVILFTLLTALLLQACNNNGSTSNSEKIIKLPADSRLATLYENSCKGCHNRPSSGAPQANKPGHWKVRLNKGMGRLLDSTKFGYRAMPPGGLCRECSDDDFRQLIEFMATE